MRIYSFPEHFWDFAAEYVTELINHTASHLNNWRTQYETLHGDTPDISIFCFHFYEPIFYLDTSTSFPNTNMLPGRFLGFARTTGDSFTFLILPDQSGRVIHRSVIQRRQHTIMNNATLENTEAEEKHTMTIDTTIKNEEEEGEEENKVIKENHTTTIENDHEDNDIILEDNNIISAIPNTTAPAISNTTAIYNHSNNIRTDIEDILNLSFNPEDGMLQANIKWKDG
jgi:hypothetical protein